VLYLSHYSTMLINLLNKSTHLINYRVVNNCFTNTDAHFLTVDVCIKYFSRLFRRNGGVHMSVIKVGSVRSSGTIVESILPFGFNLTITFHFYSPLEDILVILLKNIAPHFHPLSRSHDFHST
jgi:hypothetical protein